MSEALRHVAVVQNRHVLQRAEGGAPRLLHLQGEPTHSFRNSVYCVCNSKPIDQSINQLSLSLRTWMLIGLLHSHCFLFLSGSTVHPCGLQQQQQLHTCFRSRMGRSYTTRGGRATHREGAELKCRRRRSYTAGGGGATQQEGWSYTAGGGGHLQQEGRSYTAGGADLHSRRGGATQWEVRSDTAEGGGATQQEGADLHSRRGRSYTAGGADLQSRRGGATGPGVSPPRSRS